jgi:hypothetical protein
VTEAIPTFVGLVAILVSVTNVIAMSSRTGETGIHMGMTEMFQDLGSSVGPVVVAALLATFTRAALVPNPAAPGGFATVIVPSAAAFSWIFGVGLAVAVGTALIGLFLNNYRAVESPQPDSAPVPTVPPVAD